MQTRTSLWEMLASSGDFALETKLIIDNTEYTEISAPIIDRALCKDTIEVGNCIAGSLTVAVRTADTFPTGAAVEVWKRVWNASRETSSEWIIAGTFYISKRQKDYASGLVTLTCYDAMLKGSEDFYQGNALTDMTGWPHSMSDVVTYIAGRMGVQIDSRTTLRTESRYRITATPQGTLLDVLGHIGACMGGNWTITPEGKLRFVQLTTAPTQSDRRANRVQAQTELGETYTRWSTIDSENVEHYGEWGMQDGYVVLVDEDPDPTTDAEIAAILSRLGTSDAITITGVSMSDDLESITYTAGTDTGYQLAIIGNPYCSQEICNDLLATLGGIEYHPFNADKAIYDPAAELGDPVMYKDIYYSILMTEKANLNVAFRGDIGAPTNKEIEDEYPYKSPVQKNYEKAAAMANDAKKEAINYLARDNSGIMVARMTDENRYTPRNVPSGVKNTYISNTDFQVRDGTTVLAKFGEKSEIGKDGRAKLLLDAESVSIHDKQGVEVFCASASAHAPVVGEYSTINMQESLAPGQMRGQDFSRIYPAGRPAWDTGSGPCYCEYEATLNYNDGTSQNVSGNAEFDRGINSSVDAIDIDQCHLSIYYSASGTDTETIRVSWSNVSNPQDATYVTTFDVTIKRAFFGSSTPAPAYTLGVRYGDPGAYTAIVGNGLTAEHGYQFACGQYNEDHEEYAFMVGNGSPKKGESNAYVVTWDGNQLMALDENATTGTDAELYSAIIALGWEDEVLV